MERELRLNGVKIPDPNPSAPIEQVRQILAATYPDITTATMEGPTVEGSKEIFSWKREAGSKG
jgi:PRTRC genetic system protein C